MKKMAALILVLVLALSAAGAFAVSPAELLGTWYTGELNDGGVYLLTGDYHLELRRDSTATLVMNGQAKEFKWKLSGEYVELTSEDQEGSIDLYYENEQLSVYMKDFSKEDNSTYNYIFTREQPEIFQVPGIITAETEEEFFGDWSPVFAVTSKGIAKVREEDAALGIKVEFAQITMTEGENVYYALTDYVDGKLKFNGKDLNLQDAVVIVELAENGYARVTLDGVPAEEYNYYLVKAGAAAEKPAEEEAKSE